jgi:hypothetical protein
MLSQLAEKVDRMDALHEAFKALGEKQREKKTVGRDKQNPESNSDGWRKDQNPKSNPDACRKDPESNSEGCRKVPEATLKPLVGTPGLLDPDPTPGHFTPDASKRPTGSETGVAKSDNAAIPKWIWNDRIFRRTATDHEAKVLEWFRSPILRKWRWRTVVDLGQFLSQNEVKSKTIEAVWSHKRNSYLWNFGGRINYKKLWRSRVDPSAETMWWAETSLVVSIKLTGGSGMEDQPCSFGVGLLNFALTSETVPQSGSTKTNSLTTDNRNETSRMCSENNESLKSC